MKTYFYCVEDSYGQRTGAYKIVQLKDSDIQTDRFGLKLYQGNYLFEDEYQCLLACLN
jgi:hypothetical protein